MRRYRNSFWIIKLLKKKTFWELNYRELKINNEKVNIFQLVSNDVSYLNRILI